MKKARDRVSGRELYEASLESQTEESQRVGRGSGNARRSPLEDPGPRKGFGTSVGIQSRSCIKHNARRRTTFEIRTSYQQQIRSHGFDSRDRSARVMIGLDR